MQPRIYLMLPRKLSGARWRGVAKWCTSPGYAYVHESVVGEFVAECKKAVIELYGTDPKNNSVHHQLKSC